MITPRIRPFSQCAMVLVMSISLMMVGSTAQAGPAGLRATEATQLMNNAELGIIAGLETQILDTEVKNFLNQVEQLRTQIQSYQIMLRNIASLPQQFLQKAMQPVVALRQLATDAGALAATGRNLDQFLRSDVITDPMFNRSGLDRAQVSERYDDWMSQWNRSLETNLGAAGATMRDVETEANLIDQITQRFGTERGQLQVLQGANQIAAVIARQLGGLRQITATQAEQTSIAWGRQLSTQDLREAEQRAHERQVRETLDALDNRDEGRSLSDIFVD